MNATVARRVVVILASFGIFAGGALADEHPLKVFILAGQSNMQGHAHVRTIEHIGMDPKTAPLLEDMLNADRTPRTCDEVWISSIGSADREQSGRLTAGFGANARGPKIGPEFTFGIYAHKRLKEPILIIKTAWGGKSLHTDFRPPSAGPYRFSKTQLEQFRKQDKNIPRLTSERATASGHYYRLMIDHVRKVLADIKRVYPDYDAKQGYELAGFVWFQGWNDMVDRGVYPNRNQPVGYSQYSELLARFIRDVRKDLGSPRLPFVIGVMGAGGPVAEYLAGQKRYAQIHQNFRDAMAAPAKLPEFRGNVKVVLTEKYWDQQLTRLRARDAKVQQQIKKLQSTGKLERKDVNAARSKLRAEEFTARELRILETGVSNAEFHYLGSAKIFAQIGKAFAEALVEDRR